VQTEARSEHGHGHVRSRMHWWEREKQDGMKTLIIQSSQNVVMRAFKLSLDLKMVRRDTFESMFYFLLWVVDALLFLLDRLLVEKLSSLTGLASKLMCAFNKGGLGGGDTILVSRRSVKERSCHRQLSSRLVTILEAQK
jgi:hypothetical protein